MRAIVVDRWMEPSELTVQEIDPSPAVGRGMLRIERARRRLQLLRHPDGAGAVPGAPPFPFVPGAEIAGVVAEVGPEVKDFAVGDRVMASRRDRRLRRAGRGAGGGRLAHARRHVVRGRRRLPDRLSDLVRGAGLPRAGCEAGETLLVHAAAGGVGIAAVQIGKALGARVIATAGGAEKLEIARAPAPTWRSTTSRRTGSSA